MTPRVVTHDDSVSEEAQPRPVGSLLSKSELAGYLGYSTRTLDRLAAEELLPTPTVIVGGRKRWDPEVVRRWLASKPRLSARSRKGVNHAG